MRITFLLIAALALASQSAQAQCNLAVPGGFKGTNLTNCSVDLSWNTVSGASYYVVEYRVTGTTNWQYSDQFSSNSVTVGNLLPSTSYEFAVASYCSNATTTGFSNSIIKMTKKCSTPTNLVTSSVTANSATLGWQQVCNASPFTVQYKKSTDTKWTTVSNIAGTSVSLSGLASGTIYNWKVKATCGSDKSSYTTPVNFTTQVPASQRKNVVFFVLDDARYDISTLTGAPSWFQTPHINRIANEGVNFQITIPATSQCSPSRATYYTGLYPHENGVTKNGASLSGEFPLIQQILKDHGYYTGFIGKYGQYLGQPKGFDWTATSDGDIYNNALYHINGKDTAIQGNIIDVYPRLATTFLNSVPQGKSFVLFYFTRAPHDPTIPTGADANLYLDQQMPFPSNFQFYTSNYPSFYNNFKWNAADTFVVNDLKRRTFQTIKGTDDNLDTILTWIEARNWLDSTLIIFTSDNGMLMGEHRMDGKILALEESIRVPLFIRYPAWFAPNTVISDEIASNIDIATTLLDFAGIPNTYGFQGISLKDLGNRTVHRKSFLYEYAGDPLNGAFRSVRTLTGKYVKSYCSQTTEEFYDLVNDPKENVNQIFNPEYATTIDQYRGLLDSLRGAFSDNANINNKDCQLISGAQRLVNNEDESEGPHQVMVQPNLTSGSFILYFQNLEGKPTVIQVFDYLQHEVYRMETSTDAWLTEVDCSSWASGVYFVVAAQSGNTYSEKLVVRR
jgi:arylsulfatase A-like enzyme